MSQQRPQLVQLEPDEDANSVKDRLSFMRGTRVLLVWPEKGTALTRKLDLVLIQREAMRRTLQIALVTHDAQVVNHAEELNISTFETVGLSERKRWKRARSRVFSNRYTRPANEPEPADVKAALQPVASRQIDRQGLSSLGRNLLRVGLLLAMVGTVLAVAYIALPGATVLLTPAQQVIEASVNITALPDVSQPDVESALVPLVRLSVEVTDSGTIAATGLQPLSDTTARGTVVFINRTDDAVSIPVGTTISTSASTPVLFNTIAPATLDAGVGSQIEVEIEALQTFAGEQGNVGEGLVNTVLGSLADSVDVRNVNPTTGGESRVAAAVAPEDPDRLTANVRQQLQEQAYTEMESIIGEDQFIILETIRIAEERDDWKTFSAEVGETTDTLTLRMRAVVEGMAVDERFGQEIAFARLGPQVPAGRVIQSETLNYTNTGIQGTTPTGGIVYGVTARAMVAAPLEPDTLSQQLAGRSIADAFNYIITQVETQENTVPEITLVPRWLGRMPVLPMRIDVQFREAGL